MLCRADADSEPSYLSGEPHDLAVFLDEVAKCVDIFVIDLINMINCEAAEFFTLEKRVLLIRVTRSTLSFGTKA